MIVFVVSTGNGPIAVFKSKEIAKASILETWPDRKHEVIEDTSRGTLITIRENPKIGESGGNYLTSVRITPLEVTEAVGWI
jgi:hypothetical protein